MPVRKSIKPSNIAIHWLDTVTSTNSYMQSVAAELHHGAVVAAHTQSSGRGQRGNSWEAEPGANITMSIFLKPSKLQIESAFLVSEAVAVAVANVVSRHLMEAGCAGKVAIKWPNDIYVDNKKIAGILIENSLHGSRVSRVIVGLGLNVNQTKFTSPAPNPVSLAQLTGSHYSVADLTAEVAAEILTITAHYDSFANQLEYTSMLWRGSGIHPFEDALTGQRFKASVDDVLPNGHIVLRRTDGHRLTYAFKEVVWL